MKKYIRASLVLMYLSSHNTLIAQQEPDFKQEFNRLNKVEVSQLQFSTQIMLDFASPIVFKKKIVKEKLQLLLAFPGMLLEHFDKKLVLAALKPLKKEGLITKISITDTNAKPEKKIKVPKVIMSITFASTRQVNNGDNGESIEQNNQLLVKWTKIEDPHRLILDIFTKESLDKLHNKGNLILYAQNDTIKNDSSPHNTTPSTQENSLRIAIDAGHGGSSDSGAQGFNGLLEKNVTLDLAKRVRTLLNKDGFQTLLTRENDTAMSLQDRSGLASQLKADFFVSIHVNSCGKLGGEPSGIETFYLQEKKLLPPTRIGGFIFVNLEKNFDMINAIDAYHKNNINYSKKLASSIQNNLLTLLKNHNMPVNNRGIKPAHFRVLFRNEIPSVLVEVGFITNKKECDRLALPTYRQHLADGICKGIKKFSDEYRKAHA